jgi:hypothetical protein
MKVYMESEGIIQLILNLGTRWRYAALLLRKEPLVPIEEEAE